MKHSAMKIKTILNVLLVLAVLAAMLIPVMPAQAAAQEFPLQLIGDTTVNISKADLTTLADTYPSNTASDSDNNTFKGTALWRLIAQVDGGDPNTLNTSILGTYKITLTGLNADLSDYVKEINAGSWSTAFTVGNNIQTEDIFVANKVLVDNTTEYVELPLVKPQNSTKLWYPTMLNGTAVAGGGYKVGGLYKIELTGLPHFITVNAGLNGSITPAGTDGVVNVNDGDNQTFTITPDLGFHITSLTVDGTAVVPPVFSYTFDNVTADHTIAATFAAGTQDWPLQLIGASTYNMTKTEFEALAAEHPSSEYTDGSGNTWKGVALFRLIGMVDGGDPAAFNNDLTSYYSIKLTAADGYSKTVAPSDYAANFIFANNENVFVANKVKLSGTEIWTDLPLTKPTDVTKLWYPLTDTGSGITVGNMRVAALVKIELLNLLSHIINVTQGTNGTITPAGTDGKVYVVSGAGQTFSITPNSGYHIASLTVDGTAVVPPVFSYTFDNVTADHTIAATFAAGTQDWPLQLIGASTYNMTKTEFEALAAEHPSNEYTDGSGNTWKGVALYRLIGMVDGGDPAAFNNDLTSYYSIKLTAADGYSKTIVPSDYATNFTFADNESVFIANKVKLSGTETWTDLPLTKPTDVTKLWYPLTDTGSGITVGNMRVAALVKIELLNLPVVYTISTLTDGHGTAVANPGTVSSGGSSEITITPYAGYAIATVLDNETDVTGQVVAKKYTLTNITANHAISVTFSFIPVVTVNLVTPSGTVTEGDTFDVVLMIDTNIAMRGWQTIICFDNTKLIANSVIEGNFMSGYDTIQPVEPTLNNEEGRITDIAYAIIDAEDLSGPSGSGTLCTISFTVKEDVIGTTAITPSGVFISDVDGNAIPGVEVLGDEVTIVPPGPPTYVVDLAAGYNTFSTPISLDPQYNTLGQIFSGKNVSVALGYDAQTQAWFSLDNDTVLKPCQAIFVYMVSPATITLKVHPDLTAPPSTELYTGWNLVSLANLEAMDVDIALTSAKNVTGGLTGYIQVISPELGNQDGWTYVTGQPVNGKKMKPSEGYWVYMLNNGELAGFTTTPLD